MTRILKFAMVWFIALALPIQGFAAVAMLCCGSSRIIAPTVHVQHESRSEIAFGVAMAGDEETGLRVGAVDQGILKLAGMRDAGHVVSSKHTAGTSSEGCVAGCLGVAGMPETGNGVPLTDAPGLRLVAGIYPSEFTTHISGMPQRPPLSSFR